MQTAITKAMQLIKVSCETIGDQNTADAIDYVGTMDNLNSNQRAALISLIAHIGRGNYLNSELHHHINTGQMQLATLKRCWLAWHTSEPEYWQREAEIDLFICERE